MHLGTSERVDRVVLLGDSTAAQLSNALIGAAAEHDTQVEIVTRGGCPFGVIPYTLPPGTVDGNEPDQCTRFYEESLAALEADPPDVVVMSSATDHWVFGGGYRLTDPGTGEPVATVGEQARLYEEGLSRAVRRLRDAGIRVAIVESHPKPSSFGDVPYDFRACSRLALMLERSRCLFPPFTIGLDGGVSGSIPDDRANQLDRSVAKRDGASTWSLATAICPQGRCEAVRDGHLVWRDGAHISGATSERLAPVVAADIERTMDSAPGTLLR